MRPVFASDNTRYRALAGYGGQPASSLGNNLFLDKLSAQAFGPYLLGNDVATAFSCPRYGMAVLVH